MVVLEAPKDAKGRPVNADDAEARAAARERRRLRNEANQTVSGARKASEAVPPKAPPSSRKAAAPGKTAAKPAAEARPKPSKRGVRQEHLEGTMPSAPAQASGEFYHPDPLAGDVIMDATARLLAPRTRTAQAPAARQEGQGRRRGQGQGKQAQPQQVKAAQSPRKPQEKKAPAPAAKTSGQKNRGHGRRGGPPEIVLRTGNQKDSTEQPSLMKPYYISRDD